MKIKLLTILAIAAAFSFASANAAVLITNFGSTSFTPITFTDFISNVQTPTQITLDGTEGNSIFGDLSVPINILGSTESITITGIYSGTFNGQFSIDLFDANDNSLTYKGFYSSFTPNVPTTVNLVFVSEDGTFNGTVARIGFTAGSLGGSASVDLVATNLTAVPEPSSLALLIGGVAVAAASRRRRNA